MTITDYRNFDLLITRAGDRYRAFVVDAPEGEASVVFDLPFTPGEMPQLGGSGVVRGVSRQIGAVDDSGSVTSLTDVGRRLFEAIFHDKVQTLLAASLSSVTHEGAGLRLRLRFEEDAAELAALPWETLYDPTLAHFIGLGEQSPVVRYLSLPRSRSALLVEPPLRVLAVLASPAGLPPLDMEREWQVIQDALAGLTADGKFVLERLTTPSLSALQQRLLGEPVHILHFVGHGVFDESSQAGSLALEDGRGRAQLVQGRQLAALLRNHPAMRLAYLNACEGALASGQSVFTGVAQMMVQQGVPAAVAMQAEISDTSAIELARTFYTALAGGRPVDAALTQARVALSVAGSQEWAIPVLFSRSPDNRLFDIREVLPTPDCPYPGMTPFSEAQQAFFFGRDKEIGEAVERLRQHPFLTVVGPSGSGKSSLIYAGVIPALRKSKRFGPGEWSVQIMRPGQHPMAALAEKLGCSPATLSSVAITERTLLFVDQFEETFTLAETGEAQAFLEALQGLIGRPNLFILLTARADFYPELMASSLWQPIRANRLELTPLGDDELWAAIVEPAAQVGVTVDEALAVQLIADAAGQSGVLPLVQETLVLLWQRVERRQLGLAAYKAMAEGGRSGLQVAIDRRATTMYNNLPDEAQPIARRIFLRLIQFGEGRADTRRQQTVNELRASGDDPDLFDQTLATLTASRLLTTSGEEGGDRRVDIAHEALITGWPRLQVWLRERKEVELTRRRLEGKAKEWVRLGRGEGGLLDKEELAEAIAWLTGSGTTEFGASVDLLELMETSRNAINPEWHKFGTIQLIFGTLTIAALLSWLFAYMRASRTLGSAQLVTILFIAALLLATVVVALVVLRSDRYAIQRLSHAVASRKPVSLIIGLAVISTVVVWLQFGLQSFQVERDCRALQFNTDNALQNIAVVPLNVSDRDAAFFALRLSNAAVLQMITRVITENQASHCRNYLNYVVQVRSEKSADDTQVAYIASVRNAVTGRELMQEKDVGVENCRRLDFLALKVLWSLNLLAPGSQIYESVNLPAPDDCETYFANEDGFRLFQQGDYDNAEASFRLAIDRYPQFAWAHNNLGKTLFERDRLEEAISEFRIAVSLSPNVFEPFETNLENACFIAQQFECAEQATRRLIEVNPHDITFYQQLSVVLREWGKDDPTKWNMTEETFDAIEEMIANLDDPKDRLRHSLLLSKNRGILAFCRGEFDKAQRFLELADRTELMDYHEEIVYYLARIAQQMGKTDEACDLWAEHFRSKPSGLEKDSNRRRQYGQNQMIELGCR
ncbi:MAG: CHAT domain-containing protein [Anaerolineales bacterium]|nr:CHAT domain-containing protein [Anaerolineales bacterium]